jgi:hypothetical protein
MTDSPTMTGKQFARDALLTDFAPIQERIEASLRAAKVSTKNIGRIIKWVRGNEFTLMMILNANLNAPVQYDFKTKLTDLTTRLQKISDRVDYDAVQDAAVRQPSILFIRNETIESNVSSVIAHYAGQGLTGKAYLQAAFKIPTIFVSKPETMIRKTDLMRNGIRELNPDINKAIVDIAVGLTASPERLDLCAVYISCLGGGPGLLSKTTKMLRDGISKALGYSLDSLGFGAAVKDFEDPVGRAMERMKHSMGSIGYYIAGEAAIDAATKLLGRARAFLDLAHDGLLGDLNLPAANLVVARFNNAAQSLSDDSDVLSITSRIMTASPDRKTIKQVVDAAVEEARMEREGNARAKGGWRDKDGIVKKARDERPKAEVDEDTALFRSLGMLGEDETAPTTSNAARSRASSSQGGGRPPR